MKSKRLGLCLTFLIVFFGIFLVPFISAEVIIQQSSYLYSVGDDLSANVSLIPSSNTNNFLIVKVVCSDKSVELLKQAYDVKSGERKSALISLKLDRSLVGDLTGNCFLEAEYSGESGKSQEFIIANSVEVSASLIGAKFEPGKEAAITGSAKKKNGEPLQGFLEASIIGINTSLFDSVNSGSFNVIFPLSADLRSGNHELKIRVYEKDDSGKISNEGSIAIPIKITGFVKRMDIALSNQEYDPGKEVSYNVLLYDQSGAEIVDDAGLIIYEPNEKIHLKKLVKSGDKGTLPLSNYASPGYWKVSASFNSLKADKSFFVNSIENASVSIVNQTLIVTNIGNVPYKKILEVSIGNEKELKEVSLEVGESKKFILKAQDGNYKVAVSDGSLFKELGEIYLTGNAVGILDSDDLESGGFINYILWIILIIALAAVAFFYYKKIKKDKYIGKTPSFENFRARSFDKKKDESEDIKKNVILDGSGRSIVGLNKTSSDGKKEEVALVSFKIKNLSALMTGENNAISTIERALSIAKESRARVYEQGEYKTIILSESLMKEKEILNKAISLAQEINNLMDDYNKRYALKISYGIGVHIGDVIIETSSDGRVRFTSVGSTTIIAKRAADRAVNMVYLSEMVRRRTAGKVKSEKVSEEGFWKLQSIINRNQHSEFIGRFMKKQKNDPKSDKYLDLGSG